MPFTPIDAADIVSGKPVTAPLMTIIKEDLDFLNAQIGGGGGAAGVGAVDIPNGSFELDTDTDGVPDSWTRVILTNGAGSRVTTDSSHGAACLEATILPGGGNGGAVFTSDFYEVTGVGAGGQMVLSWDFYMNDWSHFPHVKIIALGFDENKIATTNRTIYDSTSHGTSGDTGWHHFEAPWVPGATTKYEKLEITLGDTDQTVAVSVTMRIDNVTFRRHVGIVEGKNLNFGPVTITQATWTNAGTIGVLLPVDFYGEWYLEFTGECSIDLANSEVQVRMEHISTGGTRYSNTVFFGGTGVPLLVWRTVSFKMNFIHAAGENRLKFISPQVQVTTFGPDQGKFRVVGPTPGASNINAILSTSMH